MSDDQQRVNVSGGISAGSLLGVVFVTLKLCGVIDWSWWWVTCPFWGPLALVLGIGAVLLLVLGLIHLLQVVFRVTGIR